MLYFGGWQPGERGSGQGRADLCPKADSTPDPTDDQRARAFIAGRRGLHAETAVSSDRHLEIAHALI